MSFIPHTESVSAGTETIGTIYSKAKDRHETFGPSEEYLATFPTIQAARKALFELYRDSQGGLAKA